PPPRIASHSADLLGTPGPRPQATAARPNRVRPGPGSLPLDPMIQVISVDPSPVRTVTARPTGPPIVQPSVFVSGGPGSFMTPRTSWAALQAIDHCEGL